MILMLAGAAASSSRFVMLMNVQPPTESPNYGVPRDSFVLTRMHHCNH
jgi:hypothetical protein